MERHGWREAPVGFAAYVTFGHTLVYQGRLEEGAGWLERAVRQTSVRSLDPTSVMMLNIARGWLETLRGRHDTALALFEAAARIAATIVTPHTIEAQGRALVLGAQLRMGRIDAVERTLAELSDQERDFEDMRVIQGMLRLAQGDANRATAVLAPVIDGISPVTWPVWMMQALVLTCSPGTNWRVRRATRRRYASH